MNRVDKEERTQRIRIGLTGLAFVFLLVLLGTAISRSGEDPLSQTSQNELATPEEPNEPLAEIGAAPAPERRPMNRTGRSRHRPRLREAAACWRFSTALAMAGAAAIGVGMMRQDAVPAARPPAERPTLALLTSLPLVFGESFGLESGGSAALTRLEQRYNVLPIGVADAASLEGQTLLLMAHPRAQPAEAIGRTRSMGA